LKEFPESTPKLETRKGIAFHQKSDIFKGLMFYSYADDPGNFIALSTDRVKHIIQLNLKGEKPEALVSEKEVVKVEKQLDYENVVGQDSLTRFDNLKRKKKKKKHPGSAGEGFKQVASEPGKTDAPAFNRGPRPQGRRPKPRNNPGNQPS
jgi:hypothetical protein